MAEAMTDGKLQKIRKMLARPSEILDPFTLREYIVACEDLLSAYDALVAERGRLKDDLALATLALEEIGSSDTHEVFLRSIAIRALAALNTEKTT